AAAIVKPVNTNLKRFNHDIASISNKKVRVNPNIEASSVADLTKKSKPLPNSWATQAKGIRAKRWSA
ncbi:MAG: hypothetical protein Q8S51_11070, partial [Rhodoferax sp.]|uniref:hypothetical protein n=1 Tax=Rhodoferax sp. TaxID=50421 RepID=UPI0027377AFA